MRKRKMRSALNVEIENEKETDDTKTEEECLVMRKKNSLSGSQEVQRGSVTVMISESWRHFCRGVFCLYKMQNFNAIFQ